MPKTTKPSCDTPEITPLGFIGYKSIQKIDSDIVRIYINCKDESHHEGFIDVIFYPTSSSNPEPARFEGLNSLSMIKKFHRFIGCLEERAKENRVPREKIFESSKQVLNLLSRVKNSRDFGG